MTLLGTGIIQVIVMFEGFRCKVMFSNLWGTWLLSTTEFLHWWQAFHIDPHMVVWQSSERNKCIQM